jgi:hypothetical protein
MSTIPCAQASLNPLLIRVALDSSPETCRYRIGRRSLHDLDAPARPRGETGRVTRNYADRRPVIEDVVEDLATDLTGRIGDDDHETSRE